MVIPLWIISATRGEISGSAVLDLAKPCTFLIATYRENCSNDYGVETNVARGAIIAPLRQEPVRDVLQGT